MLISIGQRDMTKVFSYPCSLAFQRMCWGWVNLLPSTSSRASERGPAVLPEELYLSCGSHWCGLSGRRGDFQCLDGPSAGLVVGTAQSPLLQFHLCLELFYSLPGGPPLLHTCLAMDLLGHLNLWVTNRLGPEQWPWAQMVEVARSESLPLLPPPTCSLYTLSHQRVEKC